MLWWHAAATPSLLSVQDVVNKVPATKELFQALYSHFLRLADADVRAAPELQEDASSAAARLEDNAVADRILCVRAMAALYTAHAGHIGAPMSSAWPAGP